MDGFTQLTREDLDDYWRDEEGDFTPWLAENIQYLEDVTGLNLEVVDTEREVGRYRLDILARDPEMGREVVVENQLNASNHGHLGQSIAYASGVDADVIAWIAPEFHDEHIDAVQWLNQNTQKGVDFFAIRIEVLRIGESDPAIQFTAVAEPSGFRDEVKEEELTDSQERRKRFWRELTEEIQEKNRENRQYVLSARKPGTGPWLGQPSGNADVKMRFWLHLQDGWIDTRLVFKENSIYHRLKEEQSTIEAEFDDEVLWWDPDENRQDAVVLVRRDADLYDEDRWLEYVNWFTTIGERVIDVFGPRIN